MPMTGRWKLWSRKEKRKEIQTERAGVVRGREREEENEHGREHIDVGLSPVSIRRDPIDEQLPFKENRGVSFLESKKEEKSSQKPNERNSPKLRSDVSPPTSPSPSRKQSHPPSSSSPSKPSSLPHPPTYQPKTLPTTLPPRLQPTPKEQEPN